MSKYPHILLLLCLCLFQRHRHFVPFLPAPGHDRRVFMNPTGKKMSIKQKQQWVQRMNKILLRSADSPRREKRHPARDEDINQP